MKKLFRFKYEACNGTCYAHEDDFYNGLKTLSLKERTNLVTLITKAHDSLCDNTEYFFGLDKCEKTGLLIGHFKQPTRLDLYTGTTLVECITDMCLAILDTEIPQLEGICEFGNKGTENLVNVIMSACAA